MYTSCIWGYIYTKVIHTIYIWRGTTSAIYFMYNSRSFKAQSVNNSEKAKIHIHNNKRWNMTSKEQGLQEELVSIEFWCLLLYSLNRWRPLVPAQCLLMMFLTISVFCKWVCKLESKYKLININNCNIYVVAQVPDVIDTNRGCIREFVVIIQWPKSLQMLTAY